MSFNLKGGFKVKEINKIVQKTIKVEEEIKIFVTNDGKEFTEKEKAIIHEEALNNLSEIDLSEYGHTGKWLTYFNSSEEVLNYEFMKCDDKFAWGGWNVDKTKEGFSFPNWVVCEYEIEPYSSDYYAYYYKFDEFKNKIDKLGLLLRTLVK